jgi:hypothetical protein
MSDDAIRCIMVKLGTLETKLDSSHEALAHHAKSLYGNGRPGLVSDVQAIRSEIAALLKEHIECPARKYFNTDDKRNRYQMLMQFGMFLIALLMCALTLWRI